MTSRAWKDCVLHHPLIDTTDETIEELEKLVLDSPILPYEGQELTPTEFYQMFRCWYDATKQRGEFPRSVDAFGKKVRALVGLKSEEPKWITRESKSLRNLEILCNQVLNPGHRDTGTLLKKSYQRDNGSSLRKLSFEDVFRC